MLILLVLSLVAVTVKSSVSDVAKHPVMKPYKMATRNLVSSSKYYPSVRELLTAVLQSRTNNKRQFRAAYVYLNRPKLNRLHLTLRLPPQLVHTYNRTLKVGKFNGSQLVQTVYSATGTVWYKGKQCELNTYTHTHIHRERAASVTHCWLHIQNSLWK